MLGLIFLIKIIKIIKNETMITPLLAAMPSISPSLESAIESQVDNDFLTTKISQTISTETQTYLEPVATTQTTINKIEVKTPDFLKSLQSFLSPKEMLTVLESVIDSETDKRFDSVYKMNRLVNLIPKGTDLKNWKLSEYWATPLETLTVNSGDDLDFSILKYYLLEKANIPSLNPKIIHGYFGYDIKSTTFAAFDYDNETYILSSEQDVPVPLSQVENYEMAFIFDKDSTYAVSRGVPIKIGDSSEIVPWDRILKEIDL